MIELAAEGNGTLPVKNTSTREAEDNVLRRRMEQIGEKLLVLSGKGGVGKSTVSANISVALAQAGKRVGLLDVDVHGPSIPRLMGLEGNRVNDEDGMLLPVPGPNGVKVMSMGFLLPTSDDAVIWRGPRKYGLIRQFLLQVKWGELDFLIIDAPPGTGDEPMAVAEMARPDASALLVTTPQKLAVADVRRSVSFCREVSLPILGILENMSGLECPSCKEQIDLFGSGGGERLATAMQVPFLGKIPLDPAVVIHGDEGRSIVGSSLKNPCSRAFTKVVERILTGNHSPPEIAHQEPPSRIPQHGHVQP